MSTVSCLPICANSYSLTKFKVQKPIDALTKVQLNIPQLELTLVKTAQLRRHKIVNTRSEHFSPRVIGSMSVKFNIFTEFILLQYNSDRTARMIYVRKNSNTKISGQ